jgi:hypothetical protein
MRLRIALLALATAAALGSGVALADPPLPQAGDVTGGDNGETAAILGLGFGMLGLVGAGAAVAHIRRR